MSGRVFIGSQGEYVSILKAKENPNEVTLEEHDDQELGNMLQALGEEFVEVDPVEEGG